MAKKVEEVEVANVEVAENKKVKVIMNPEPGCNELSRVVAVNYLTYRIPYGVEVEVEECIAEVIKEYNKRIKALVKKKKAIKEVGELVQL